MKLHFILKYKFQITFVLILILTSILGIFLFQHFSLKKEKRALDQFYSLQIRLKEKIKKVKSEKEKENKNEKKVQNPLQKLLKKNKNPIDKKDLEEKLKVEVESYKKFISKNKGRKSSLLAAFELGILYTEAKDFESIERILSDLVQNIPNPSGPIENSLFILLGDSFIELKKWDQALTYFNKILGNKKNQYLFPLILLKTALCYEKLNQKNQAILNYKKLIHDFPKSNLITYAKSYLNLLLLSESNQKILKK